MSQQALTGATELEVDPDEPTNVDREMAEIGELLNKAEIQEPSVWHSETKCGDDGTPTGFYSLTSGFEVEAADIDRLLNTAKEEGYEVVEGPGNSGH